jgi:antitoxin VapB
MSEDPLFPIRIALLREFMAREHLDGLLLTRIDNFAMATGGRRNYVSTMTDVGANALFVPRHGAPCFVGNAIEAPRQMAEELGALGCDAVIFPWHEGSPAAAAAARFTGTLASDDGSLGPNVHARLATLRALLTPLELEKYRQLGVLAAEAMTATLAAITPGMPEADIAARLVWEGQQRRCQVPVALVAADDRIAKFRHPLPTLASMHGEGKERGVNRYVMVVGGFLREGLVASLTRFKAVDSVPEPLIEAYARICAVEVRMQAATLPGATLGEVFTAAQAAYLEFGFGADEWRNHHQGGATGYAGRTAKGAPGSTVPVLDMSWDMAVSERLGFGVSFGAAFAWNPSAPGVKSEDTFLLFPDGQQCVATATPSLPRVDLPGPAPANAAEKSGIA